MSTDKLLALQPADLWDGLPAGVLFSDIKSALLMVQTTRLQYLTLVNTPIYQIV